jgi:hypothetical protein
LTNLPHGRFRASSAWDGCGIDSASESSSLGALPIEESAFQGVQRTLPSAGVEWFRSLTVYFAASSTVERMATTSLPACRVAAGSEGGGRLTRGELAVVRAALVAAWAAASAAGGDLPRRRRARGEPLVPVERDSPPAGAKPRLI